MADVGAGQGGDRGDGGGARGDGGGHGEQARRLHAPRRTPRKELHLQVIGRSSQNSFSFQSSGLRSELATGSFLSQLFFRLVPGRRASTSA